VFYDDAGNVLETHEHQRGSKDKDNGNRKTSSGGVVPESVRIVDSRSAVVANLLAFLVFFVLPAGETAVLQQFKNWLQR